MIRKLGLLGLCGFLATGCGAATGSVTLGDPTLGNSSGTPEDKTLVMYSKEGRPTGYMITVVDNEGGRREYDQMQTIPTNTNGVLLYANTAEVIVHCGHEDLSFPVDFEQNEADFSDHRDEFYPIDTGCGI